MGQKIIMDRPFTHPISSIRQYTKFRRQKKADFIKEFEIKELLLGEDIRENETQMGPHKGSVFFSSGNSLFFAFF